MLGKTLLLFALLCSASTPVLAKDAEKKHFLRLKTKTLAQACHQLSRIYDVAFVCAKGAHSKSLTADLVGSYSITQALHVLLRDTDYAYQMTPDGIIVTSKPAAKHNRQNTVIDEVVVMGIQASLTRAQTLKKATTEISDAVVAQDIAAYPNINTAEALQRIPGVVITREAGEGRQVSLRGLSADFTLVTVNGMPVLANNDSPMDSRVQKQHDRSFDFNLFSAELFSQTQVFKAYSVEQPAGGLAGTLALRTTRPFDREGFNFVVTPQVSYNEYTKQPAERITSMVSNTWGDWGAILSVSYGKRWVEEQGANTIRWRQIALPDNSLSLLSPQLQSTLAQGDVIIPRGNRYSIWRSEQNRLGIGGGLEYKGPKGHVNLDVLHAKLDSQRDEFHLYPRGYESTPIIWGLTQLTDAEINHKNELIYSRYQDARVATESRYQQTKTDYDQLVLSAAFTLSQDTHWNILLGEEKSSFIIPISNKIYTRGVSDVSVDYRDDRYFADIQYASNLRQDSMWYMNEIDLEEYASATHYRHAKTAINQTLFDKLNIEWGLDFNRFTTFSSSTYQSDLLKELWANTETALPSGMTRLLNSHSNASWLGLKTNQAIQSFSLNPYDLAANPYAIQNNMTRLREDKSAAYISAKWQTDTLTIQAGLRYQKEKISVTLDSFEACCSTAKHQQWLPSFNLAFQPNAQWIMRLGLSRNIGFPSFEDLSSALAYDEQNKIVYGANHQLAPYTSDNVDIAIERYIEQHTSMSVSVFYKNISDFIVPQATEMTFGEANLPNLWADTDLDSTTLITLVNKTNQEQASIAGIETMVRYERPDLPKPWGNMGVVGHYTFIQGEMTYYNEFNGQPLFDKSMPNLSKHTGSLTLYYETERFNARLSATYRDSYIYRVNSANLNDEDETGFHPSTYLDASVRYKLNSQWQLQGEALNLTNEREEQYTSSQDRAYNSTTSGRTFYLGVNYRY